jgi:KDO2-lipid IV(A) lauroyltransferase
VTVLGHYGNWEYLVTAYSRDTKHTVLGVYKPLSNPNFEKLLTEYRTRYGMVLVPLFDAYAIIKEYTDKGEKVAIMLIGDQTPAADRGYWMDFLHQDTPVFRGAEKLAKDYNFPLLFATLDQTGRGQYSMSFETVFENPRETEEGEITEFHTKKLEKQIRAKPHLWLWSHKRWKHTRPADTPDRFISKRFPGQ